MSVEKMIEELIKVEGGYVNDPRDAGGETNFGITKTTAQANGYTGAMKTMSKSVAVEIYKKMYWVKPGFDKVAEYFPKVAEELFDAGVNMGPTTAGVFLQRALNALNSMGKDFPDLGVDGDLGQKTFSALAAYKTKRGVTGEATLLKCILCLRGARYVELCEKREANEAFMYGWISNRIVFK